MIGAFLLERTKYVMTKEQLLALGLTEEHATKAAKASEDELKLYIEKSKYDTLEVAKKALETDIKTRDTQLEELKKSTGDVDSLKTKIAELQTSNEATKTEYENKLKQMQIDSAVEKSLMMAKAKNVKAVKALLDLEKADIDNDTVKGLDDQIKKLTEAEDTKFLFETVSVNKPKFKGVTTPDSGGGGAYNAPKTLGEAVAAHYTSKE